MIAGDFLCRYLGRKVKSKVRENYFFPGDGIKKVGESLESLVDDANVASFTAGSNDVQGCRSEELIWLGKQVMVKVRDKAAIAVARSIMEAYCQENNILAGDTWDH